MSAYLPTANEMIALPTIREATGAVESLSFLSMGLKGQVELCGDKLPVVLPFIEGVSAPNATAWERLHDWVPALTQKSDAYERRVIYLAPVGERGFLIRMELDAKAPLRFVWGAEGEICRVNHCVNETKPLDGLLHCYESGWNHGFVIDYRMGAPLFAFAPMCDQPCETECAMTESGVRYRIVRQEEMAAGESRALTLFFGLGFEEVAAATSAKEMLRRGYACEYEKTARYLDARARRMQSDKRTHLYNRNLFFCMFYAAGMTMDTEELVCITSRSPRYYVSAAYWDRDTLLWAFPAILDADHALARRILTYVFTRQRRNFGVHSRYIDGTVLEPGFELDELVSPILALAAYVKESGDHAFFCERFVQDGVAEILTKLEDARCPALDLYETFLQPTDDERTHPYLTYDNVLVWRAFCDLLALDPVKYASCRAAADGVRRAIQARCVFTDAAGAYYAWSVNENGDHDVYDEPPGSLQLLPYYGYCGMDDAIWQNTVKKIRSSDYAFGFADCPVAEIGCRHAPHPWVLSLCNSLLCGYGAKAWRELDFITMDNGVACESVDEFDGACQTGAAFATCAGFVCHSMLVASEEGRI